MRNLQPHLRGDMTAVENAAVSPGGARRQGVGRLYRGQLAEGILTSATSSRRTTPRTRATRHSWLLPPEKTKHLWNYLDDNYLAVERKQRVYDVDDPYPGRRRRLPGRLASTPRKSITWSLASRPTFPAKRAMMPNGGWRMVEQAIKEAGKEPDPEIAKIFTKSTARPTMTASSACTINAI